MTTDYSRFFEQNLENIPDTFIKFSVINTHVDSSLLNESKPIYLGIDHGHLNNSYGGLSNVTIDQKNDKDEIKHIAYFYNSYNYTKGIGKLIQDIANLFYYRIMITGKNVSDNERDGFNMKTTFFIDKMFLLHMYEQSTIPEIVYSVMIDSKNQSDFKRLKIPSLNTVNVSITKNYKRPLFEHQKKNISWMKNQEIKIDCNSLKISTYSSKNYHVYNIKSIGESLLYNRSTKKMINKNEITPIELSFKGGILADDIGLGKTYSIIGLILERHQVNKNPSLIICPRRLCLQWQEEFNKSCELKIKIISSITQFKKLNLQNIKDYDVIIMSYQFLTNKKYLEYVESKRNFSLSDLFLIETFKWERLVLDEAHEYISMSRNTIRKNHYRETKDKLFAIKSKYRWLCTGTPYESIYSFWELCRFITCNRKSIDTHNVISINFKFKHIYQELMELIFIKNTKESVKNQVAIPEPIIDTEFLVQTSIERAIYDSALGDKDKMIQLCNHILVSDQHINILGNQPIPLNEIHLKMTEYHQKKNARLNTRINNLNIQINENPENMELITKKEELNQELKDSESKLNIFTKLSEKLKEEETCPVCYEELKDLIKSVTPCGHVICGRCVNSISEVSRSKTSLECPMCRNNFPNNELRVIAPENFKNDVKLGTKMSRLIEYSKLILSRDENNRILVFSQWDSMLKLVSKVLEDNKVKHLILNGSMYVMNNKLRQFKLDKTIRIILLSMEKAASGLNLTEANHIVLLDTLNNDKETSRVIEEQAIGRSVRIGQKYNVKVQRFIMKDTIEHEYYLRNIS